VLFFFSNHGRDIDAELRLQSKVLIQDRAYRQLKRTINQEEKEVLSTDLEEVVFKARRESGHNLILGDRNG